MIVFRLNPSAFMCWKERRIAFWKVVEPDDLGLGKRSGREVEIPTIGSWPNPLIRWHRSMKNVVKLQNYYSPEELEWAIAKFVDYYNQERHHESLDNLTPADVYKGRREEAVTRREQIKR